MLLGSRHGWDYVLKKDKDDKKSSSVREQQKGEERLTQRGGEDKMNPGVPWAGENHWDFCTALFGALTRCRMLVPTVVEMVLHQHA